MSSEPDASPDPAAARPARLLGALFVLALAALLGASGLRAAEGFRWAQGDLLRIGAVDVLLLGAVHMGILWLRRLRPLGWAFALLGSLALAVLVALALRLDAGWLPTRMHLLAGVFVLTIAHQLVLLWSGAGRTETRGARGLLLAALLFAGAGVALLFGTFQGSESARWHLLRHRNTLGLPLYSLSSRTIEQEEALLRAADGGQVEARDVLLSVPVPALDGGAEDPTHVVFVLVDTWRADTLSVAGAAPELMPRMNALVEQGAALTDLHANASWTRASCATFFTGLLPEESGATGFPDRLPEAWTTLPEVFQGAGFSTAAFVTNWIQVGVKTGFGQGFDHFGELRDVSEVEQRLESGGAHIRELYARAEEVNREVFAWLDDPERGGAASGPHFLYVHYLDPHSPYLAGVEEGIPADPRERKRSAYRQEVRYTDEHLGALVDGLVERLEGDVAFVITSDHGEEFWEHGAWGHGHSLYREQLWVPGIVYQTDAPAEARGQRLAAPLELRDLYDLSVALGRPGPLDLVDWAERSARSERFASQYLGQAADAPLPAQRRTVMRRVDQDGQALIWSAYGPTRERYHLGEDAAESDNRIGSEPGVDAALQEHMDSSLRFWVRAAAVERTAAEAAMLNRLGYGGASAEAPPDAPGRQ